MNDYYVAFWNLENLFDVNLSPRRSDKLQRTLKGELKGWTQTILDKKISQLASVISRMNNSAGPDLLGVCEVENSHVLDLLVNELSPLGRNYQVSHADTSDQRGIDVAFIYDADFFTEIESFSHFIVKRTATRDIFQVNFSEVSGKKLVVIGNHWPSRRGGELKSEAFRIIAAETIAYFHERIKEVHGKDTAIIAMGDFNDEPFNRSLRVHARAERTRKKVTLAKGSSFLNLMWSHTGNLSGTHFYNNRPGILDQFLVSKGLLTGNGGFSIVKDSVDVVKFPDMITTGKYPQPLPYRRPNTKGGVNSKGFSDHYPIRMKIKLS